MSAAEVLTAPLDALAPIGLDELTERASLQTRVDRKYLVTASGLAAVIDRVGADARVLDHGDRRRFGYESIYFDTPQFDSFLGAARSRPNRFKVRLRRYVDAEQRWIEVKLRDRRGRTVKHRSPCTVVDHDSMLSGGLGPSGPVDLLKSFDAVRPHVDRLAPVVTTTYRRSTIVLGGARATIDDGLVCSSPVGDRIRLADRLIVETKTDGGVAELDRLLWAVGARPVKLSKFGIGMAALCPELPANKWHRTLRRHVVAIPPGRVADPRVRVGALQAAARRRTVA